MLTIQHKNLVAILGLKCRFVFPTEHPSGLLYDFTGAPFKFEVFSKDGDISIANTSPLFSGLGSLVVEVPAQSIRNVGPGLFSYRLTIQPSGMSPFVYQGLLTVEDTGLDNAPFAGPAP